MEQVVEFFHGTEQSRQSRIICFAILFAADRLELAVLSKFQLKVELIVSKCTFSMEFGTFLDTALETVQMPSLLVSHVHFLVFR